MYSEQDLECAAQFREEIHKEALPHRLRQNARPLRGYNGVGDRLTVPFRRTKQKTILYIGICEVTVNDHRE